MKLALDARRAREDRRSACRRLAMAVSLGVALGASGCRGRAPTTVAEVAATASASPVAPEPHQRELAALHGFEEQRRRATDFATQPAADRAFGADPYRIVGLRDGKRRVGLLRGDAAVVLLDDEGAELARVAVPGSPSGLAVSADDEVLVVGEDARELVQLRAEGAHLVRVATVPVDALGMRGVALAPDGQTAYVVEEHEGRLLEISLARGPGGGLRSAGVRELGRCHGPVQVEAVAGYVAVNCLLDHTLELRRTPAAQPGEAERVLRIQHDGPLWSLALQREADGGLLIAAGGVEDHPLERKDGGFGYIDSYLYLYRLAAGAARPVRLVALEVSALDVVTPKWVAIRSPSPDAISVTTAGYASAVRLTATWRGGDFAAPPQLERTRLLPGTTAAELRRDGSLLAASPLLDAWILQRGGEPRVIAIQGAGPQPSARARLGELLFFTTMMAPWSSSEGKLSRFTCETCHFEGYVDGRTHYTGRGEVFATTRPLRGLFNNRPYFSRALDRTMTQMVHAEFRVANRHNGRDPWFALTRAEVPWLDQAFGQAFGQAGEQAGGLGGPADSGDSALPAQLSPELLREAFMAFLMDFTHRSSPMALEHAQFTALERAGARTFRARCASCHQARLVADDASSVVPFERWEALVRSPAGPIVWSNAAYAQTGVTPYVHASGARVPTLRRLYKKWPYFTNGSARSLTELLGRYASGPGVTYHDAAPAEAVLTRLSAEERAGLRAFLELL